MSTHWENWGSSSRHLYKNINHTIVQSSLPLAGCMTLLTDSAVRYSSSRYLRTQCISFIHNHDVGGSQFWALGLFHQQYMIFTKFSKTYHYKVLRLLSNEIDVCQFLGSLFINSLHVSILHMYQNKISLKSSDLRFRSKTHMQWQVIPIIQTHYLNLRVLEIIYTYRRSLCELYH